MGLDVSDDINLQARIATLERAIVEAQARSDTQFDRLFLQLAEQRVDASKTSARVAGLIGLFTFTGTLVGSWVLQGIIG